MRSGRVPSRSIRGPGSGAGPVDVDADVLRAGGRLRDCWLLRFDARARRGMCSGTLPNALIAELRRAAPPIDGATGSAWAGVRPPDWPFATVHWRMRARTRRRNTRRRMQRYVIGSDGDSM